MNQPLSSSSSSSSSSPSMSLFSIIHHDDDRKDHGPGPLIQELKTSASARTTAATGSTPRKEPLIQVLEEESGEETRGFEGTDASLDQQHPTEKDPITARPSDPHKPSIESLSSGSPLSSPPSSLLEPPNPSPLSSPIAHLPSQPADFHRLSQRLAETVWKLQKMPPRSSPETIRSVCERFFYNSNNHQHRPKDRNIDSQVVQFVWDSILPQCADETNDAYLSIGSVLLEESDSEQLAGFLRVHPQTQTGQGGNDQNAKMVILGAIRVLYRTLGKRQHDSVVSQENDNANDKNDDLSDPDLHGGFRTRLLLSMGQQLADLIYSAKGKRTVLSDATTKAAVLLVACACEEYSSRSSTSGHSPTVDDSRSVWDCVCIVLEAVLDAKKSWARTSNKVQSIKMAILTDWQTIISKTDRELSTRLLTAEQDRRLTVELHDKANQHASTATIANLAAREALLSLSNHVTGSYLDVSQGFSLGSLVHTLHHDKCRARVPDLVRYFEMADDLIRTIKSSRDTKVHPLSDSAVVDHGITRLRGVLRGCLAICVQSKALQKQLVANDADHAKLESLAIGLLRSPGGNDVISMVMEML